MSKIQDKDENELHIDVTKSRISTYISHMISHIESHQRPRPDGSIDWVKAFPEMAELINKIEQDSYKRAIDDSIKKIHSFGVYDWSGEQEVYEQLEEIVDGINSLLNYNQHDK